MVSLPPALEPWRTWLECFDGELIAMLGPWLLRLDPLLGRNPLQTVHGQAEPDGVDDLRQRGKYERLLLSEWAMADAAPDEFLRRAANHEHLFLAPRMITRQADSVVTAVFDAGAGQWGAPRLLHVAAWILLARRARMARARFAWGRVDRPEELVEDDSPDGLRRLLKARNHGVPGAQQYADWFKKLARGGAGDERWVIAASARIPTGFTHAIGVKLGFDEHLHLTVATPRARHGLQLPLPESAAASRVLRGEFIAAQPSPSNAHQRVKGRGGLSLQQPPIWNAAGKSVAMPLKDGTTAATFEFKDVASGRLNPTAKIRYWKWGQGQTLVCGVLTGRSFSGVTLMGGSVLAGRSPSENTAIGHYARMWQIFGLSSSMIPCSREGLCLMPGTSRWVPGFWLNDGGTPHRLVILDHAHRLHTWAQFEQAAGNSCKAADVLALVRDKECVVFARHERGCLRLDHMDRKGTITQLHWLPLEGTPRQVWLAGYTYQTQRWVGTVAIEVVSATGDSRWVMFDIPLKGSHQRIELAERPNGQRKVIGLIGNPKAKGPEYSLVCVAADRRNVVAIGARGVRTLYTAAADITTGSTTVQGDKIALVTLSSQLLVLDEYGTRLASCVEHRGDATSAEAHARG